ncbi:sulfotransferase domain-containing protein [Kiritimatiellota bacterium B12222]|nr:sulfotransferase domain-containing protein [Kiritimatiellota bacterium B12222]
MAEPNYEKRGIGPLARKVITLSHHFSYYLAKRYPQKLDIDFVSGYPRSGTVWVTQMFSDYLEKPFADLSFLPIAFPSVMHGHYIYKDDGPVKIYVLRDGRDAYTSLFYYLGRKLPATKNDTKNHVKKYFPYVDTKSELKYSDFSTFLELISENPMGTKYNWNDHVLLSLNNSKVPVVRYENLLNDCFDEMKLCLETVLQKPVNEEKLKSTVYKYSISRQIGEQQGKVRNESFIRKGKTGDWVNTFDIKSVEYFHKTYRKSLEISGYEKNDEWVEEFSKRKPRSDDFVFNKNI